MDADDTSGLVGDSGEGLVVIYTSTEGGESQSLATSTDRGRTFARYAGNPVLPGEGREDFRDPKVFRHPETEARVMVVSLGRSVGIFRSPDLLTWDLASEFGDGHGLHSAVWECPDLFPLPLDGDPSQMLWVLSVSGGDSEETGGSTAQYVVGEFDGHGFAPVTPPELVRITDTGQDFYAAQTFSGLPDGRRVWMGWVGNWRHPCSAPTQGWTNHLSVPRELSLRTHEDGPVLAQRPVVELDALRERPIVVRDVQVEGVIALDVRGRSIDLEAELDLGGATRAGLRLLMGSASGQEHWFDVGVDATTHEVFLDRTHAGVETLRVPEREEDVEFAVRRSGPRLGRGGVATLRVLLDESSVEVFVDDGLTTATMLVYPHDGDDGIGLFAEGGTATLLSLTVSPMRPLT